jgi:carbamoyltransferase
MDIAASLQETLETIVFHIVTHFRDISGCSNLCLAGGVALNCTMNGKLINSGLFKDVFVYPAANDSGLPVGSALAAYFEYSKQAERKPLHTLYLGSRPGLKDSIQTEIDGWKGFIKYERVADFPRKAAEVLADDKVIGWVNGCSEFAPRALGNRSILADSRPERNKERINSIVKKREGFRPFAPSVQEEYAAEYFELPAGREEFSHMTFVLKVQEKYRRHLGAVTHVDGTARIHTVSKNENPAYWELIDSFRQITGTPVVLNTSFNNDVESIVDTVNNAIVCFLTTQLDYLFVEDFVISKVDFSIDCLETLRPSVPSYLLLRNPAPEKFEIANTFNKKTKGISPGLFHLLHKSNSSSTLGDILDNQQITVDERKNMLNEVFRLWESRLIILTPFLS